MADESVTYKVVLEGDAAGGAGVKQAVEDIGAAAAKSTESLQAVKDLSAAAEKAGESLAKVGDISEPTDKSNLSLRGMRETLSAVDQAARGSAIGLGKAIEGIVKMSGASDDAQKNIASLTSKLGAIGVGFGIGSSIGDAIYKNLVTPIWDAVDAYNALNDPARKAYEEADKVRNELIRINSLKLREVEAEINGIKTSLLESAEQAEKTKDALRLLSDAESKRDIARIQNLQASGEISKSEAAAYIENIKYLEKMKSLEEELAGLKQKDSGAGKYSLDKNSQLVSVDTPESRQQRALVSAKEAEIEASNLEHKTNLIELGADSKKVLADLEAAIKAKEFDIQIDKQNLAIPNLTPGQRTEEYQNLEVDETTLSNLKKRASEFKAAMQEAMQIYDQSLSEAGNNFTDSAAKASKEVTDVLSGKAEELESDMVGAGKVATDAMQTTTGVVSGAVTKAGQDISSSLSSFSGQIVTTINSVMSTLQFQINELSQQNAAINAKADLALSQVKNSR